MTAQIESLRRFVQARRHAERARGCEACGAPLPVEHRHVVDRVARKLLCACRSCSLAFDGVTTGRLVSVPERVQSLGNTSLEPKHLDALGVPVGLAFFFRASTLERWFAVFPSPAGATEADLADGAWESMTKSAGIEDVALADDVEALLVRKSRGARFDAFVVPIDLCYELAGIVRRTWRGIDGGTEARTAVGGFFARLSDRARGAA
jgi:hypothetical protein